MSTDNKAVSLLNNLLEKNYDAEQGYKNASEDVENSELKNFLLKKSKERYDFGHQIKAEISKLGGEPDKGSSVTASLHQTWMDLKSAVSKKSNKAVLEECERGEKAALEDYEKAIADGSLVGASLDIIRRQHNEIEADLNKIKTIENAIGE